MCFCEPSPLAKLRPRKCFSGSERCFWRGRERECGGAWDVDFVCGAFLVVLSWDVGWEVELWLGREMAGSEDGRLRCVSLAV